jgi:NTP pyrophosphatase (non-canonical NTP hydrolase)
MDSKEFISQAILTESPYTEETLKRLDEVIDLALDDLRHAVLSGHSLDRTKKFVYYGKETSRPLFWSATQNHVETINRAKNKIRLLHAIIGLQTELAELTEAFLKHVETGEELDVVNIKEEVADSEWYNAIIANELDFSFEELWEKVIAKLRARYPNKFTSYDAINRNLDVERKILETDHSEKDK